MPSTIVTGNSMKMLAREKKTQGTVKYLFRYRGCSITAWQVQLIFEPKSCGYGIMVV